MKKMYYVLLAAVLLTSACNEKTPTIADNAAQPKQSAKEDTIERGKYLVSVIGCGDCHTPKKMTDKGPVPDMDRFLSGFDASRPLGKFDNKVAQAGQWVLFNGELTAAAGPWGVSFAANLTPDPTGLGDWSFENFKKAIREGKYKGMDNSRPLLPPMPWQNFAKLSDGDINAIFMYLKTIKPISNRVPQALPPVM